MSQFRVVALKSSYINDVGEMPSLTKEVERCLNYLLSTLVALIYKNKTISHVLSRDCAI